LKAYGGAGRPQRAKVVIYEHVWHIASTNHAERDLSPDVLFSLYGL